MAEAMDTMKGAEAEEIGRQLNVTLRADGAGERAPSDIESRAYELFLRRGGRHGHDMDDWLEAERQLAETIGDTTGPELRDVPREMMTKPPAVRPRVTRPPRQRP